MTTDIYFGFGQVLSPGGSRSYIFLRYLDYVRGRDCRLRKDTYLRYLVQSDYFATTCEINFSFVSSGTLTLLLSHLEKISEAEDMRAFNPNSQRSSISDGEMYGMISEGAEKIREVLRLRRLAFSKLKHRELIVVITDTVFLRAFWRDVLVPAYESCFPDSNSLEAYSAGAIRYSEEVEECQARGRINMMREGYTWLKLHGFDVKVFDRFMF